MVKYCCRSCQISHHPKHKRACKKRAAELLDEELFKDHPGREECPICMLPLPIDPQQTSFKSCCGKRICIGCVHAQCGKELLRGDTQAGTDACPFCRAPLPRTPEDNISLLNKCVEKNNATAINILGAYYMRGGMGVERDWIKGAELYQKAVQLGCAEAYYNLGTAFINGKGVERDEKKARHYWELGAIRGDINSRCRLACLDSEAGDDERAYKHWLIGAKAGDDECLRSVKYGFGFGFVTKDAYAEALRAYQKVQDDTKSAMRDEALKHLPKFK